MQWPAVWRTWKTRFRTWISRRRCWMWDRTRGWSPWRDCSPRCRIPPSAVQSLKRPSIQAWLATSQSGSSVYLPGCRPLRTRWRLWQRRVSRRGQTTLFSRVCQEGFRDGRLCRRFTTVGEGAGTSAICQSLTRVFDEFLRWRTSS